MDQVDALPEAQLLAAARGGDAAAFDRLVAGYRTALLAQRLIAHRPRRVLSADHGPPRRDTDDLGEPVAGPVWLEPWLDDEQAGEPGGDPAAGYLRPRTRPTRGSQSSAR